MFYKISPISIVPKTRHATTSNVFIGEVDPEKELLAGKLFIIIEIESSESEDLKIVNFLIDDINLNYYQNEKFLFKEYSGKLKIENLLEAALTKSNKKLLKFCREQKIKLHEKEINITVGVMHKENIYFSISGKNKALLIARSKAPEGNGFKLHDILKQTREAEEAPVDKNIIFSNIISGQLPQGGYFIFSNEALPEYLSSRELIKIVSSLPPSGAVEQIRSNLLHINSYIAFLGIIIKNTLGRTEIKVRESRPIRSASSQSSIVHLNDTERSTEKLLSTRGLISLQKSVESLKKFIASKTGKLSAQGKSIFLGEKIVLKRRGSMLIVKKVFDGLKNLILSSAYVLSISFAKLAKLRSGGDQLNIEKRPVKKFKLNSIWAWFRGLKASHQIYLAIFLACIVIFSQNIFQINKKNTDTQNEASFLELSKSIEQKQNQIESISLYKTDGRQITALLDELKSLIDQLPKTDTAKQEAYDKFMADYNNRSDKARNVIKVENITEVANFQDNLNAAGQKKLLKLGESIYVIDIGSQTSRISVYDIKTNLSTSIELAGAADKIISTTGSGNSIYLIFATSSLVHDIGKKSTTTLGGTVAPPGNEVASKMYNNRLYVLGKTEGNIIRYRQGAGAFNSGELWNKEKGALTGASDFDIDGNIYVLFKDGKVQKYRTGNKEDFTLEITSPPLSDALKIQASEDKDYLYVLDPKNKRVAVFNKRGGFLSQYHLSQLDNLQDFTVDEGGKNIFVQNNASLYKFPATHLDQKN